MSCILYVTQQARLANAKACTLYWSAIFYFHSSGKHFSTLLVDVIANYRIASNY